jgi:predicted  nucleic acid-binding Zn-ribbon protein
MTGSTIGQQLDAKLADLATKDDIAGLKADISGLKSDMSGLKSDMSGLKSDMSGLKADLKAEMKAYVTHEQLNIIIKAAVQELVQVINQNTEDLREDLANSGIKFRTRTRGRGNYSAE